MSDGKKKSSKPSKKTTSKKDYKKFLSQDYDFRRGEFKKIRSDRLVYEITTLLDKQYKNILSQRDSLIQGLLNLPKDLQIKAIIDIWSLDDELKNIRDKYLQNVGITEAQDIIKYWQPFGGEKRFNKYNQYYNNYNGRFKNRISLLNNFVEKIFIGENIQGESWTDQNYNSFKEALTDILEIEIKSDKTDISPIENLYEGKEGKWKNVSIKLVSDVSVRIIVKPIGLDKRYTFSELGFKDRRRGDLPNRLWKIIEVLSIKRGFIEALGFKKRGKIEKNLSDLRKRLKTIFGLNGDPIPFNKINKSYQTIFRIVDERPISKEINNDEIESYVINPTDSYEEPDY